MKKQFNTFYASLFIFFITFLYVDLSNHSSASLLKRSNNLNDFTQVVMVICWFIVATIGIIYTKDAITRRKLLSSQAKLSDVVVGIITLIAIVAPIYAIFMFLTSSNSIGY